MFKLISRILNLSGKYKIRIQSAFLFAFIESILSKMPIFIAFTVLIGFYEKTVTPQTFLQVGIGLIMIVLAQALVHFLSDKLQSAAGFMIFADKRMELGNHLRKLPMGYFTAGNLGKINSVLSSDMAFIEEVSMSTIANMMSYVLSSFVLTVFLFVMDYRIGLIAVGIITIATLLANRMNKISLSEAVIRQEQGEKLTEAVLSFAEGMGVIKSYNLLGENSKLLTDSFESSKDTSIKFEKKITPWISGLNIIYGIGIILILAVALYLYTHGALGLPYVLGLILFLFDLFSPLKTLYGEATRLTVMNAALDRIEEVLNEAELKDTGEKQLPSNNLSEPEIRFNHVKFSYDDKEVLHDVSFDMQKNTMTALVGQSGGGKSTVANLLARFWDTDSGEILIRGVNIKDISLSELMSEISMVFQSVYLFQDTIFNNIAMGRENATKEEVIEAAKKARCYDFIMALPDGFDTMVGEGGATLSGGEKQRISIARCILKDAPIVILDEATASVDVDNESYIQEAISELVKNKTLLVIAHRLNTIRDADNIIVIKNGSIAEQGNHQSLMDLDGIYKNMVELQGKNKGIKIL